jgi:hypothetical protein
LFPPVKATAEASRCSQEVEELEARLERAEGERGKLRRQEASLRDSVADPKPDPRVFGLSDPDPLVRCMDPALDPDPDPSIIMQK